MRGAQGDKSYYLGVDLGGSNLAVGLVSDQGRILAKDSVKTRISRGAEDICDDITALALGLLEANGIRQRQISRAGIGAPGVIHSGIVVFASNLRFREVPLAAMLEERLALPVTLQNDANAAAYGELVAGAGRGCSSLVAMTIGTGIGSGIVLGGEILSGMGGGAGELGHTVIVAGGRACVCGKRGCLEAYCSAPALKAATREAMHRHPESLLWKVCDDPARVSARTPFQAMRMGDDAGKQLVEDFLFYLSIGVSNAINMLQPEIVCIGGGVAGEGEALIASLEILVREQIFVPRRDLTPKIVTAQLGNDAGIIGAALMGGPVD